MSASNNDYWVGAPCAGAPGPRPWAWAAGSPRASEKATPRLHVTANLYLFTMVQISLFFCAVRNERWVRMVPGHPGESGERVRELPDRVLQTFRGGSEDEKFREIGPETKAYFSGSSVLSTKYFDSTSSP